MMNKKITLLIVDDEPIVRESFLHWFERLGYMVETAASGFEALEKLKQFSFDLMFVDIKMPGMNGVELLDRVKEEYPGTIVIIITAYGSIDTAVEAMKKGAADYLLKPFKPEQLSLVMEKVLNQKKLITEYEYMKGRLDKISRFDNIIGQSGAMQKVFDMIQEVAQSDSSILIIGETGTGKELIAKAIHAKSRRAQHPFIAINCGAMPESLLESELFGYQKGAFTGATQPRKGFLEIVSGGTLFLDEIGETSPKMQVDLLRVLEEKKITRLGDRSPLDVDFRLVSATRQDLEGEIKKGKFREDFFYRIHVITMQVPSLRDRKDDIPLLVEHFIGKYSDETTKKVDHISRDAMALLQDYDWPGNVRELENAVERAVVLSKSRTLGKEDFSFLSPAAIRPAGLDSLRDMEKAYIKNVLDDCDWNVTRAAKILNVNRVSLHKMIKRHGLMRPLRV